MNKYIFNNIKEREYKYGFNDGDNTIFKLKKGLYDDTIEKISKIKNEPNWMFEFRKSSYEIFKKMPLPKFGPSLEFLKLDDITYYLKNIQKTNNNSWDDVPEKIKATFERLGITDAEKKYLSGVGTQYDSEVVYHNIDNNLKNKGVIFCDPETALNNYPEIFNKYFSKLVSPNDNKFAALNSCVWSGGTFIYIPKGVKVDQPLQAYFRINHETMGQFERTLIIVDEGAELNYVEGCTAPSYSTSSLHAAVVEIFVNKGAKCRYTTIQNWSDNVYNLVTKRAQCEENASMEWIDGNIGAGVTMKYPSCILKGDNSSGTTISIAVASKNQHQDTGAKMIHLGKNTSSTIISKSISKDGGNATYRGIVKHDKDAKKSFTHIECDTIIMDKYSKSDTIPFNYIKNGDSILEHEAKVSKISEEQLFYLLSRGIPEEKATEIIVLGFMEPFTRELPMEYAVELNQLIKMEMEGSVG